jgi:multiple sugar transport system substrate-binding protein
VKRDKYDVSDFYDAAVSQYVWRGKHIGMGATVGYSVIYYNPGALQEKGIPLPSDDWGKAWTWEQFVDVMRRVTITGAGGEIERYGFTGFSVDRIQITNGVLTVDADGTRTFYNTPEAIETFDWMFDLIHTYKVAQSPLTTNQLPAAQAFITGKAVSWLASTPDSARQLVPQKGLVWDSAPTPRGPHLKSDKWTFGGGNGWYLGGLSKNPDAAWELFKFMLSPDVAHKLAAGGLPPSRVSVTNSPDWLRPGDPPAHKRPMIDGAKLLTPAPKLVNYSDFNAAVNDEIGYLWRAERRGREVAERIGQRVAPILAEHQRLYKEGK